MALVVKELPRENGISSRANDLDNSQLLGRKLFGKMNLLRSSGLVAVNYAELGQPEGIEAAWLGLQLHVIFSSFCPIRIHPDHPVVSFWDPPRI